MSLMVNIGELTLKNPVMPASGTFGFGLEFKDFFDLKKLGALVVKTITKNPRLGNVPPRVFELSSGLINSIGLANPGWEYFREKILPQIKALHEVLILNIAGESVEEFVFLANEAQKFEEIKALELNVSCPNVKKGGMAFGTDLEALKQIVSAVRKIYRKPIIVKLTPNVTDITIFAKASENAGADALTLINTFTGMVIDVKNKKPLLGNFYGGVSGPAIRPMAIKMVYDCFKAVSIPIIGVGGIDSLDAALEFIMAGATAVQVGSQNLVDPGFLPRLVEQLELYVKDSALGNISELTGIVHRGGEG
ncbi:dihydroorotate dehydrogenase [Carboxydothermus pertinax]|uniref:Dihydroorotate dehydrogenase n=1 Tax=Carboxydothermus pertinax TaxID=870242 RepID=A0A1L8CXZ9_9THEO|nr:dihydroorotate dehydrogenase [Carboxydothermus pertinax]GAV23739.1 dihydroorotate dehydrogenase [Carboxydothermus pertinax]